jgi:hypothetical protein
MVVHKRFGVIVERCVFGNLESYFADFKIETDFDRGTCSSNDAKENLTKAIPSFFRRYRKLHMLFDVDGMFGLVSQDCFIKVVFATDVSSMTSHVVGGDDDVFASGEKAVLGDRIIFRVDQPFRDSESISLPEHRLKPFRSR